MANKNVSTASKAPQADVASGYFLNISADLPLIEKVHRLQDFLGQHYFHESGIMYSGWYWSEEELRPWRVSDRIAGQSYPNTNAGITPEGLRNAEDSPWVSGQFLQSQSLRYKVCGDEEALEYAKKAFNSIDLIYRLSEAQGRAGFICKPYDWKVSQETSVDQCTGVMMGLWEYLPLADRTTRQRIAHILATMADWWRNSGYKIVYFDREYDLLPYHAPRMACLNAMAHRATGDERYIRECDRLIGLCGAWATTFDNQRLKILQSDPDELKQDDDFFGYDPARGKFKFQCREVPAEIYLGLACADWFLSNDSHRSPLLKHVVARYWRQMQFGLRDDLLTLYGLEVDLEYETWSAIHTELTPEARKKALAGFYITAYYSEVCWGDCAAMIPDASIIAHYQAPEFSPGALNLASRMLARLDNERLQWVIDPDGRQLVPELYWLRDTLSSKGPGFTLLAYWRAKARLTTRDFASFEAAAGPEIA